MKRLISICCMLILCFSLFGYRLVIDVLQQAEARSMADHIQTEAFEEDALISLKVPVNLPYYTNSNQYDFVSGTVTLDGTIYQYVKRRIFNDSIEYLCLRDLAQTKLQGAREQFFQLAYDLQLDQPQKGSTTSVVKPLMLEYDSMEKWQLAAPEVEQAHQPVAFIHCFLPSPKSDPAPRPPETGSNFDLC